MSTRDATWQEIKDHDDVSVLILGGGINGIGLFRELALQGIDCTLVEKSDFVAGASSKSSRMIHGGLRYLENREFKLVRESLHERNRLIDNAPHYVAPLRTTIPLFSWLGGLIKSPLVFLGLPVKPGGRGAFVVKSGLMFYDFITRKNRRTPRHFLASKPRSLKNTPGLNNDIVATATYWDAQITQVERMCIEMIQDARRSNPDCRALNYVTPVKAEAGAVVLKNETTGDTTNIKPRVVVNATGAWVDFANSAIGVETHFMGGTKGSHLVIDCPELLEAIGDRMIYYEHDDGRVCIIFRFMNRLIMGSTDIRVDDPDTVSCDDDEIDYMMETLKDVFPDIELSRSHIVYKFCGVRPLPAVDANALSRVTRDHKIEVIEPTTDRPFTICSLIGGKLTTFRGLAEQAADKILPILGIERKCSSKDLPIGGGEDFPNNNEEKTRWIHRVAEASGLETNRVADLLDRYGTSAETYATNAAPEAKKPLQTLPSYTTGEIERIVTEEYVEHLTDLLCRRSVIAILGEASPDVVKELAGIVGRCLGWNEARQKEEIRAALEEVQV